MVVHRPEGNDLTAQNVNAYGWTPAPKPGLIPLHPLTFGALIGKPFAALRHNPKVLFGFAIVVQLVVAVIAAVIMGFVVFATFTRMESISPGSPDYYPVLWGSIGITMVTALAVGLVSIAFTAIMQGVVAADIGYAALGEKPTLGRLWTLMRPAFWRLVGWSVLQMVAGLLVIVVVGGIIAIGVASGVGGSFEVVGIAVILGILVVLALIPLSVWLSTKLVLVPSVLVLEHATLRTGIVRSWRLTRGRFWNTFGVILLVSLIMNTAVAVVSMPLSLIASLFGSVIAPTGPNDASGVAVYLLTAIAPQLLVYVLQAVAVVVQCAAGVFIYLDSRMRYEGLDHDLIRHLEQRDAGTDPASLGNPFAVDPARAVSSAPPPKQGPSYPAPAGWAPQPYPQPYAGQPSPGPQQYPGPQYPAPQYPAPPAPPAPPAAPAPDGESGGWAAPGSGSA